MRPRYGRSVRTSSANPSPSESGVAFVTVVRAEGLEPTRSLEHRHLKPACLPFHHARKPVDGIAAARRYRHGVSLPRRLALILGVIVAASGCLALGWWQWTRFESNSGSFQNLGYAVQWPMFAGFCVYAYRKFIRYEQSPSSALDTDGDITEIPAGLLPERPARPVASRSEQDATLREYNAYLAELAEQDSAKQNRTTA